MGSGNSFIAVALYRFDDTVVFEDMKVLGKNMENVLSTVLFKDGKLFTPENYWIYHKSAVEDLDLEKLNP